MSIKTFREYTGSSLSEARTYDASDLSTVIKVNNKNIKEVITAIISLHGGTVSLNHLDTSAVTDMSNLFEDNKIFTGDISGWNTSNVKTMEHMFNGSVFNGDISKWKLDKVTNMNGMFEYSKFNQDISGWDLTRVKTMRYMFANSIFNHDLHKWYVAGVKDAKGFAYEAKFKEDSYLPNFAWEVADAVYDM